MGKKKKEILDKEYIPFSEGMRGNGYSDKPERSYTLAFLEDAVLGLLDHAEILEPASLRDDLLSWVAAIADQGQTS